MSGHSKWSTIKRKKGAADAKRSNLFTKLAKNISVAARDGGDPTMNFKLRMAIDKAKSFSMPKDSIERAIQKGSGGGDSDNLETVLYEGFAPGGIAVMVQVLTDNKNRTVSEVKHAFTKNGGNLGTSGSVAWMFDLRGTIDINEPLSEDDELSLIDHGLVDVQRNDDGSKIIVELESLQEAVDALTKLGKTVAEAGANYVAKELITPENETATINLLEALDDLDDVDSVYTNADV